MRTASELGPFTKSDCHKGGPRRAVIVIWLSFVLPAGATFFFCSLLSPVTHLEGYVPCDNSHAMLSNVYSIGGDSVDVLRSKRVERERDFFLCTRE